MKKIKAYYWLTKPGIIRGNAITATAGFFLASLGKPDALLGFLMLLGLSLVIASGCVFNNVLDREIDKKMERTKKRALVSGRISPRAALIYATLLGVVGTMVLLTGTTLLATLAALTGLIFYVIVYGYYKRRSSLSTLIGSISGAIPPVVGYVAVTNHLDNTALSLFLILVFWQMPHFFAIALYRKKEYASAGLPILSVAKGDEATKRQMVIYLIGWLFVSACLVTVSGLGLIYIIPTLFIGLFWLYKALDGYKTKDSDAWARQVFGISLLALTVQCLTIIIDSLI